MNLKHLINWIRKQVKEANKKGIVLGLSGGIDSSVTAVLCKKAVGNNLLGLILPCHTKSEDIEDALLVAKLFKIRTKIINLTEVYDSLVKLLPRGNKIAYANLKPRLRMLTLYYFANKLNYLTCGTSNKSELMVGYFTKYGDGACDIAPLGNLLKRDVKKLAIKLSIPQRIIDKVPSAGLWEGQTDEGELGITYNELDEILTSLDKKNIKKLNKIKVEKVKKLIQTSIHKRTPIKIYNTK